METSEIYWERKKCRICNSENLLKYIDFGLMPIATFFKKPGQKDERRIPLGVNFCKDCGMSQLDAIVKPEILFSKDYPYSSSVSKTFEEHCTRMAKSLKELFGNKEGLKILDIASNDGCLLKEFRKEGFEVIGVDPAEMVARKATEDGIYTIYSFWDRETAKKVLEKIGKVDVVTATNVFAHLDDVHNFIEDSKTVMSDEGLFLAEFSYAKNQIEKNEFDIILHEHLSYYLVAPLVKLFSMHGMKICDLKEFKNLHGGTLRVMAIKNNNTTIPIKQEVINNYLEEEKKAGLLDAERYLSVKRHAEEIKKETRILINKLKAQGKTIAGYGAPVKGNTFVNYCELTKDDIKFIVDDTKEKQGLIYAGTEIPIVPADYLKSHKPDYLLILAWNFADEIIKKTQEYKDKGGKYIIAIPKPRIID